MNVEDYRDRIIAEFQRRCERLRGRKYLISDFAREIDLSPSFLSQLMNHRSHISMQKARGLATKLFRGSADRKYFLDLVEAGAPRSRPRREIALKRIQERSHQLEPINENVLTQLDWRHFTLLELAQLPNFGGTTADFRARVALSDVELNEALLRLEREGFLKREDGRWSCLKPENLARSTISSAAIQEFHRRFIDRSKLSFEKQKSYERQFESFVMTIDRKHLPEAKKMIEDFKNEFYQRFRKGDHNAVYGLGVQFFRLDEEEERNV